MKRSLGKGLGSLIPEKSDNEIKEVKIDSIFPNRYQMRKKFDPDKISELAETIKENGLVQPLVVAKNGNKYMLIAGERRLRAAKEAGLNSIPCIEKDLDESSYLIVSLIENIQRENLSAVEEANAYAMMAKDFSMTQQEISDKVGKSRSAVANSLRILSLPEDLRDLIEKGGLTAGHARALLSIKDEKKRRYLAEKIVKEKMTVREAEKMASIISGGGKKQNFRRKTTVTNLQAAEMADKFEKALGTKVNIKLKGGSSK